MLGALIYWLLPLFFCIRFIWMPIKHSAIHRGEYMHYFNLEEDDLTIRFEMTMAKPRYLPIFSAIFILCYIATIICYFVIIGFRPKTTVDDPRFHVQSVYLNPTVDLRKTRKEAEV